MRNLSIKIIIPEKSDDDGLKISTENINLNFPGYLSKSHVLDECFRRVCFLFMLDMNGSYHVISIRVWLPSRHEDIHDDEHEDELLTI